MGEPREVRPIQFFGDDSMHVFDRDFRPQVQKIEDEKKSDDLDSSEVQTESDLAVTGGQPEPRHDPVPPNLPKIPVPAPDAEPLPVAPQSKGWSPFSPPANPSGEAVDPSKATEGQMQAAQVS